MIRVQILLTDSQGRRLEALARRTGMSKSTLEREGLETLLQKCESHTSDSLLELVGQVGNVGRRDVSRRHDSVLRNAKLKRAE